MGCVDLQQKMFMNIPKRNIEIIRPDFIAIYVTSLIRYNCNLYYQKTYLSIQQKAHLKKHCMINHCYNSEEFNLEYPRPGLQSIPKTDYIKSSPVRIGRPPLERHHRAGQTPNSTTSKNHPTKIPKKHSVTFEDLFGELIVMATRQNYVIIRFSSKEKI